MKKGIKGFTLVEVLTASSIAILVIGAALAIWTTVLGVWHTEGIKSDLLGNMQIAMEKMKQELMLSDGNKTLISDDYNGISFPLARDDDQDGVPDLDDSNHIIWGKTVVYHVFYNVDSYELRKTVFSPRNNTITTEERQAQLESVITSKSGDGGGSTAEDEIAKTDTIISKLKLNEKDPILHITPFRPEFDGYGDKVSRSNNVGLGSILLAPGYHTLSFEIAGKNGKSSGYGVGIDSFSITPAPLPCALEAEDYISLVHLNGSSGIAGSSGDSITKADMTPYGVWGGNYQLGYGSDSVEDYITLRFYYDSWRETNFNQGPKDNVVVEFNNEDGAGGSSGDNDYVLSLDGNQTEPIELPDSRNITPGDGDDTTYRVIVPLPARGMLCSIRFSAGTSASLTIEEAYISERQSGQDGGPVHRITFNNCNIDPRNSGQEVSTTTGNDITIPANSFGWSNWISIDNLSTTEEIEYFTGGEYFVTFYIETLPLDGAMSIKYWQGASDSVRSYTWIGEHFEMPGWGTSGAVDNNFYAISEVAVRYVPQGTYISQIYDTGIDDPQFTNIIWNINRNNSPDANVNLYVRSNDDENALSSTGWTGPINAGSSPSGNASISTIAGGRYVQFQAEFFSYESGEDSLHQTNDSDSGDNYNDDEDYDMSCILKDVTITWPGEQRIVDLSGYYTLKPSYGKFTVKIDGQYLTKGLEAKLTATKASYAGRGDITCSVNTEIEFRNTNK